MTDTSFTCASCQGVFEKGVSDAEAEAEAAATFGYIPPDNRATVCESCFQQIMAAVPDWARQDLA